MKRLLKNKTFITIIGIIIIILLLIGMIFGVTFMLKNLIDNFKILVEKIMEAHYV